MNKTEQRSIAKSYLEAAYNWRIARDMLTVNRSEDNLVREALYRGLMKAYNWSFIAGKKGDETPASVLGKTDLEYKSQTLPIWLVRVTHCGRHLGEINRSVNGYFWVPVAPSDVAPNIFETMADMKRYLEGRYVA